MLSEKNAEKELVTVFSSLLDEYVASDVIGECSDDIEEPKVDAEKEIKLVLDFVQRPCSCGNNCQAQFAINELLESRSKFRWLSRNEKNCYILSQISTFIRHSDEAQSGRTIKKRERQKFDYRINSDRPVCREVFLFYHGETIKRLKHLQKHLIEVGTVQPIHGNTGRTPNHACSEHDKAEVVCFIKNFAAAHGLPDPGRDLKKGKGKLRILLPAVLNYLSVHRTYQKSTINGVGYRTFIRIWSELVPHISFHRPRSDLCMTCENFKKLLNHATSDLTEERDEEKIQLHKQAIIHLEGAKKERDFYWECIRISEKNYISLGVKEKATASSRSNFRPFSMHYSWDFAQQIHYPYENQQVGPIYFKTPRRAQLFGVCSEGIPKQINYLIDEADFTEKNANTVITLLDHFFTTHSVGEKHAFLTADNCVAQNKNNAVLQYLMYRILMGLHDKIDLSFMLVGHTKFAPDGYFGLIKYRYRRSNVYTYDQLADLIDKSTENGHNICQHYRDEQGTPNFIYRDWTLWLSKYFKNLPNITKYHHFHFDHKKPGIVVVKESIDGDNIEFGILKKEFPFSVEKAATLPDEIKPSGLSAKRAWYLYEQIREHIPRLEDKDLTCPLPNVEKPAPGT